MQIGCVEPSSSPYASPLVLVWKKEGGFQVCIDYHNINQSTVLDRYPIPRIDELVDMVVYRKPRIFSSLDLMRDSTKSGWQRTPAENSIHLPPGIVSVSLNAVWAHQCSSNISLFNVTAVLG